MLRRFLSTWRAFLVGGLAGAAIMWLMAPMTGDETRRVLRKNMAEAQIRAGVAMEEAQDKARQISDIGRRMVEEQKSAIERGASEAKNVVKGSQTSDLTNDYTSTEGY